MAALAHVRNLFASLLVAAAAAAQAAPPAKWTIESLGALGPRGSFAHGLNNRGDIVGSSSAVPGGFFGWWSHGFLWHNGVMQDVGTPAPWSESRLVLINDHGLAVGVAGQFVHTWQDGTWTALGFTGEPADINKSGAIVGSTFGNGWRGWLYRDGVLHELPRAGGVSGTQAVAVNDRGLVAGTTWLPSGEQRAFTWDNGVMQDLGTLGGFGSRATDMNNHGEVVGTSSTGSATVAFIYDRGGMRPLIDTTTNAHPVAINDRGAVVGSLDNNNGSSFLYEDGVLTKLEEIPAVRAAGWVRLNPQDINDRGWIIGSGMRAGSTVNEAFVLKPR